MFWQYAFHRRLTPAFRRNNRSRWAGGRTAGSCASTGQLSSRRKDGIGIPAIRDRDTGIWQPVILKATNALKIGDPQVITTLPLPRYQPS